MRNKALHLLLAAAAFGACTEITLPHDPNKALSSETDHLLSAVAAAVASALGSA